MKNAGKLIVLGLVATSLSACGGHYRQAKEEAFANRVADRCIEAARSTQIVVVPAGATTTVVPVAPAPESR